MYNYVTDYKCLVQRIDCYATCEGFLSSLVPSLRPRAYLILSRCAGMKDKHKNHLLPLLLLITVDRTRPFLPLCTTGSTADDCDLLCASRLSIDAFLHARTVGVIAHFTCCRSRFFFCQMPTRTQGQPGEQWTMFFKDPSGNNLEFKAMVHPENLFAKYNVDEFDIEL